MTWTDKALLPVMVVVVLHLVRALIDSFVEDSKVCVKTEVMDNRM